MKTLLEVTGGAVILTPIILIIGAVVSVPRAWAASVLWGWFITPAFGIPAPSMLALFGLSLVVTTIHPSPVNGPKEKEFSTNAAMCWLVLHPLFSVAFGWVALKMFGGVR